MAGVADGDIAASAAQDPKFTFKCIRTKVINWEVYGWHGIEVDVQTVEGVPYFKLMKKDWNIKCMLICGTKWAERGPKMTRALHRTQVVENIRDEKEKQFTLHVPTGKVRRYLRDAATQKKLSEMPAAIDIDVPDDGLIRGRRFKVLLTKPRDGLWVELSSANIEWLRDAVGGQLEQHDAALKDAQKRCRKAGARKRAAPNEVPGEAKVPRTIDAGGKEAFPGDDAADAAAGDEADGDDEADAVEADGDDQADVVEVADAADADEADGELPMKDAVAA